MLFIRILFRIVSIWIFQVEIKNQDVIRMFGVTWMRMIHGAARLYGNLRVNTSSFQMLVQKSSHLNRREWCLRQLTHRVDLLELFLRATSHPQCHPLRTKIYCAACLRRKARGPQDCNTHVKRLEICLHRMASTEQIMMGHSKHWVSFLPETPRRLKLLWIYTGIFLISISSLVAVGIFFSLGAIKPTWRPKLFLRTILTAALTAIYIDYIESASGVDRGDFEELDSSVRIATFHFRG